MNYTIMDYVHWRGEQNIKEYPYNEIDYLIFSELAYVHLDDIFSSQNIQPITLFDAYQKYSELYTDAPILPLMKVIICLKKSQKQNVIVM